MRAYPDASLLVSAFAAEISSDRADRWLRSLDAGALVFSDWCLTELSSAFAAKVRSKVLTFDEASRAVTAIPEILTEIGSRVSVDRHHFTGASALLMRSPASLKGGDALHLAIAADIGAKLWTLDRGMATAGGVLGLDVELLA